MLGSTAIAHLWLCVVRRLEAGYEGVQKVEGGLELTQLFLPCISAPETMRFKLGMTAGVRCPLP